MIYLRSFGFLAISSCVAITSFVAVGCSSSTSGGGGETDSGAAKTDSGTPSGDTGAASDTGTAADTGVAVDTGTPVDTGATSDDTGAPADTGSATETGPGDSSITCNGTPATHAVTVGPNSSLTFSPSALTICPGDTVTWTWAGSGHDVTSGTNGTPDNNFCNGATSGDPGDTNCAMAPLENAGFVYSHVFPTAGTFPYYCRPHFSFGMTGTITVQ
jgi:plastocyanin